MPRLRFVKELVCGSVLGACFSLRLGILVIGVHRRRA